jgi:hypothetical protein
VEEMVNFAMKLFEREKTNKMKMTEKEGQNY